VSRPPRIAVVGRQNVGKSTLVNRLFGRREAIADEEPGVTRDRIEIEAIWRGKRFGLVDTAGYRRHARGVEAIAGKQAERAATDASVVLLVVDAQAGVTEEDAVLARGLQRATMPVLVVANKVDSDRDEAGAFEFQALGLGEPIGVSALHGRAAGDLLDRLIALLPEAPAEVEAAREPRFALVGRPNVGKSSLFNRLLGEERSVVYEEAGTTRDSVDAVVTWAEGPVRFIDTAGMRREMKTSGIEYYSLLRASRAIERAHVVPVVIDADEGFTAEDRRIMDRVLEAGRGLLVVANKWDLALDRDRTFKDLKDAVRPFARANTLRVSAKTGQGVRALPSELLKLHALWSSRAPTARVNEVVQRAQAERPPPRSGGLIHYATQVSSRPPTFVLFGGKVPDSGYRRFVENRLRAAFGLDGVPIRMSFRQRRRKR